MAERKPATKILDTVHSFRGHWHDGAVTRVRIYDTVPPTIIASELPENTNTSITNAAQHLWPEIVKTYLPERMEHMPPARFIEHYPPLDRRSHRQEYTEVIFPHATPRIVYQGRVRRLTYGEPAWRSIGEEAMAELLGGDPATD